MLTLPGFRPVPWDTRAFGMDCYEVVDPTPEALETTTTVPGHYTLRLEPRASTALARQYGFYYCDTQLEPYCPADRFIDAHDPRVVVSRQVSFEDLLGMCHGAFSHCRFNRDPNLPREQADRRFDTWLAELHGAGKVAGVLFEGRPAAFLAVDGPRHLLAGVGAEFRGRGLGRFLYAPVCRGQLAEGFPELVSSVSAANVAVVNLHVSLGFRLRKPVDVYHRCTR